MDIDLNLTNEPDTSLLFVFDGESGLLKHEQYSIHQINKHQAVMNLPSNFAEQSVTIEGRLFGQEFSSVTPYMCTYQQLIDFMVVETEPREGNLLVHELSTFIDCQN